MATNKMKRSIPGVALLPTIKEMLKILTRDRMKAGEKSEESNQDADVVFS